MPSQIGYFDTLKSVAGKVFTYLASITVTGTDGKTITCTQDTSLDEAVAVSSKAPKASPVFTTQITTPLIYGSSAANGDITIEGTSDATKTISYVILQATGGNVGIGTTNPAHLLTVSGTNKNIQLGAVAAVTTSDNLRHIFSGVAYLMGQDIAGEANIGLNAYYNTGFKRRVEGKPANIRFNEGITYFQSAGEAAADSAITWANNMVILENGNVGIGMNPTVQFELSGSVGQKASGTTWSNPSDSRLKKDIKLADLDRCYEIIKNIPLKRFTLKNEIFTADQAKDRSKLGWIAEDVKPMFPKATPIIPFTLPTQIPDGEEEYQEQAFEMKEVEKVSIEIIAGKPILVKKKVEEKILFFDELEVTDENGRIVMQEIIITPEQKLEDGTIIPAIKGTRPLIHQMPRMVTKTKPKFRQEVIEDCLTLDADQLYAALYGAVQKLMKEVEYLKGK